MNDQLDSERCAVFFKALAEPARLRIVEFLQGGPQSVSEIAQALEVDLANASHHLRVMFNAGLVKTGREGKFIIYSLAPEIAKSKRQSSRGGLLDFGCCRLEWGGKGAKREE